MECQQVHAIVRRIHSVVLRQNRALEKGANLGGQRPFPTRLDEAAEPRHGLGISVVRGALQPKPLQHGLSAEQRDELFYARHRRISTRVALESIAIEAIAVAPEGVS